VKAAEFLSTLTSTRSDPNFSNFSNLSRGGLPNRNLREMPMLEGAAACDAFDDMPAAKNQDRGGGPGKVAKPAKADGDAAGRALFGLPEMPEEPLLLRDGRRLWRFRAGEIPDTPREQIAELIHQAHWHGAGLVADGRELVVVERWLSNLPREALVELRRCAGGVIAELLSRGRAPLARRRDRRPASVGLDSPEGDESP
jgi:hypothetical protein